MELPKTERNGGRLQRRRTVVVVTYTGAVFVNCWNSSNERENGSNTHTWLDRALTPSGIVVIVWSMPRERSKHIHPVVHTHYLTLTYTSYRVTAVVGRLSVAG